MKSIIKNADWRVVFIVCLVVMVVTNVVSGIYATHTFRSLAREILNQYEDTANWVESSMHKARERDKVIDAEFDENFNRIMEFHDETESRIEQMKDKLKEGENHARQ